MLKKILYSVLILFIFPINLLAANSNLGVATDIDVGKCTNIYQDDNIYTSESTYFSRCVVATCKSNFFEFSNYSSNKVVCTNGNNNPYKKTTQSGCSKYKNTVCNSSIKYCSELDYVDCNRKYDGTDFKVSTTTKKVIPKTTTKIDVEQTTPVVIPSNTRLSSIVLSNGVIPFNPDTYNYDLTIDSIVNSIDVTATPEDVNSTVSVNGNNNLQNGSIISVIVTGTDGSTSEYKINITKNDVIKLSSNNNLKTLVIKDYNFPFNPRTNSYNLTIEEGVNALNIDYETEDEASTVLISGNENLKSGSKITLTVTAPDGSVKYYTININVKKKSNFIKILFIILIVIAILAGAYYIYIKFIANKNGDKYEYE